MKSTEDTSRHTTWLPIAGCLHGLAVAGLLTLGGCDQATPETSVQPEPAETAVAPSPPQQTPLLESAGAKLTFDQSGELVEADLTGVEINDELAAELSGLSGLKKLVLRQSSMSLTGWKSLGELSSLEQFDIRDCAVDNEQLEAAISGLAKLRALRMSGQNGDTQVDDDGLQALDACPDLRVLAADHLWVSADGLAYIKACPKLSELYLAGTLIDDAAMSVISEQRELKKLRIAKTSVGNAGLVAISGLTLEDLDISECSQILDDAMVPVGKMKSLKRLNLWRDSISNAGLAALADLTNLEWLNLDNTHIGDDGLDHLSGMTQLKFLHLGSTAVSDAGMPKLAALQSLKDLKVTRTSVTAAGVEQVSSAIPGVDVQLKYIEGQ